METRAERIARFRNEILEARKGSTIEFADNLAHRMVNTLEQRKSFKDDAVAIELTPKLVFYRNFAEITNDAASGLFLSQIYAWQLENGVGSWFSITYEDCKRSICLTRKEWESARKVLADKGILESKRIGTNPSLWYRLNLDVLSQSIALLGE